MDGNVYDRMAYPGSAFPDTHPDRLATIAHLLGMQPAPPDASRVLELGCGDGANLIALAYALPDSSFVGVDRAAAAIERGRAMIAGIGLTNVRLEAADLLDVPARFGEFDYILAHGVYSWVPEPVRRRSLEICRASLAAQGIAFISYLALPGNRLRDGVRDVMLFHVRSLQEPRERVRQARAIVRMMADAPFATEQKRAFARSIADELDRADDGVIFHDFLADINEPFLFADFVRQAAEAELQFVSEAEYAAGFLPMEKAPPRVADVLRKLERDVLLREQYTDFLRFRGFRQTLLCRKEVLLTRPPPAERVASLIVGAHLRVGGDVIDLADHTPVTFQHLRGEFVVERTLEKAALAHIADAWPGFLSFDELAERVRDTIVAGGAGAEFDASALQRFLMQCYERGRVQLWTHRPRLAARLPDYPRASDVARWQVAHGSGLVSNLRNESIELGDGFTAAIITLMDGTRDRAQVLDSLVEAAVSGSARLEVDGRPVIDPQEARSLLADRVDEGLRAMVENALVVG